MGGLTVPRGLIVAGGLITASRLTVAGAITLVVLTFCSLTSIAAVPLMPGDLGMLPSRGSLFAAGPAVCILSLGSKLGPVKAEDGLRVV